MASRFLFIGPDEKHFDMTKKSKIKHLVKLLFDYSRKIEPEKTLYIYIKPATGFTSVVAEAILEYMKEKPDVPMKVYAKSEYKTDFEELPEKTQKLFLKFMDNDSRRMLYVKREKGKGQRGVITEFINTYPVYYADPNVKNDNRFTKELEWIEIFRNRINLFENVLIEPYTSKGVRKRSHGLTFNYRIKTKLPNGNLLVEEKGGFLTASIAEIERKKRLVEVLQQETVQIEMTIQDVFDEFARTKNGLPALQSKYQQFFSTFVMKKGLADKTIQSFVSYSVLGNGKLAFTTNLLKLLDVNVADGRVKNVSSKEKDQQTMMNVSKAYTQGYFAMLDNLFNYAYQQKYISIQPLYLQDKE